MFTKKTTRSALALLLALTLAVPVLAAVSAVPDQNAVEQAQTIYPVRVNGEAMTQDPVLREINGVTYVGLRTVSQALDPQAQAGWDGKQAKVLHPGVVDVIAVPGQRYVVSNQRYLYVPNRVQVENGTVLIPLEALCKAFDATWVRQADGSFDLTTGSGAIAYGGAFYNQDDLYWLSRIINAESGNQPLEGKIAVGNVILNRVRDHRFPNTIYGVIYQKNQFTPAATGSVKRAPNAESVLAAKLCLDGGVALDNVLYFNRVGLRCWASRNRTFVATIAGHSFYA